ncbi:MAG TPA: methyltransferase [Caulobacteraceae bacterium]|nr:methyltransferase [Caulobacteraceae bacterium]
MNESGANVTGAFTDDRILGGRVALRQPARGYRAGLDAALLAAACDAVAGARVVEAGCGVGAALLAAAARRPQVQFCGVERDPAAVALARHNIAANDLAARVEVLEGDVEAGVRPPAAPFDAALCNPPFFDDPGALRGPHPARRGAYVADAGLAAWTGWLAKTVRDGGTITLIHRADRLADILALLGEKAGSFQIRPIQPFADEPAGRVIVRAVRGGRAPLRLLPALVLHERGGAKHAPAAEAILRGEAGLAWL